MKNVYLNAKIFSTFEDGDNLLGICGNVEKTLGSNFYLTCNGKIVNEPLMVPDNDVHIHLRLLGGKGGFGSMLRAIGAQIEKTTNREACRDLSGRRLRDINEEKRLKAWMEKEEERETEKKERRKKKLEKMIETPKIVFKDPKYEETRSTMIETVSDSVEAGLKTSIDNKRKTATVSKVPLKKKKGLWIDDDLSSDSDSSDDSDAGESSGIQNKQNSSDTSDSSVEDDNKPETSKEKKVDEASAPIECDDKPETCQEKDKEVNSDFKGDTTSAESSKKPEASKEQ